MDRQALLRKIMSISDEVERLKQNLIALQSIDIVAYPENYNQSCEQTAFSAELISCRLRTLVYATTNTPKNVYLQCVAEQMDIHIEQSDEGILNITLPCLMPKRNKRATEYITDPLYVALSQFVLKNAFRPFGECVLCFTYIYDKTLPSRRIRDYDNIETRSILNVINGFLLTDDGGAICDVFSSTQLGLMDCTIISIMKKDQFPDWILRHKNNLKNMSCFL